MEGERAREKELERETGRGRGRERKRERDSEREITCVLNESLQQITLVGEAEGKHYELPSIFKTKTKHA